MIIDIITLFPESFNDFCNTSIIKRAIDQKLVTINVHNLRDYTPYSHGQVDDTPYGGGPGMVLMIEPIDLALKSLRTKRSKVILLTPKGNLFKQQIASNLSNESNLIIICGHYEGFDERINQLVDLEVSIGDFVLTGGEVPAMVVMDSVIRLIPGVINQESLDHESFNNNLLDYPVYTKPRSYQGMEVPEILLSGNHQAIEDYRLKMQQSITKANRPDLWELYHEKNN